MRLSAVKCVIVLFFAVVSIPTVLIVYLVRSWLNA